MQTKKYPLGWADQVLYRMCEKEPLHTDEDIIVGKIWIIGRSYAAAIERQAGGEENFYAKTVAPAVRNSGIDQWIKLVLPIERVTTENWETVLSAHKKVTDLFKKITGQAKRSLASKYLHFHAPNGVFIFDSTANTQVRNKFKRQRFKHPSGYDNDYAAYVARCIKYRDLLEKTYSRKITPRDLDRHLLGYQEEF